MKSSCERFRQHLDAWLDDELTRADRAELEQHIATCEACGSYFVQAGAISTRLIALGRAADAIAAAPRTRPTQRSPLASPLFRIAAAFAILAVAGLSWRFGLHRTELPATVPTIGPTRSLPLQPESAAPDCIVVASATPTLAVHMKTENPRVQLVMFYEPMTAADPPPQTTAPNL